MLKFETHDRYEITFCSLDTYSSCSSMPFSSKMFSCVSQTNWFEGKNSFSACSGRGVGVSKMSVSTIDPFELPNETLRRQKITEKLQPILVQKWVMAQLKLCMQQIMKVKLFLKFRLRVRSYFFSTAIVCGGIKT